MFYSYSDRWELVAKLNLSDVQMLNCTTFSAFPECIWPDTHTRNYDCAQIVQVYYVSAVRFDSSC